MSLHLAGVGVRICAPGGHSDAPTQAAMLEERYRERGALVSLGTDVGAGSDGGAASRIGLGIIPADTPPDLAARFLADAASAGIPVEDLRGIAAARPAAPSGVVTLIGGGPGDPELITVAGARALAEAEVILADHLGPNALLEEAAARGAEVIDVAKLPYGKQVAQERINALLIEHARAGRRVVRLKGGDPFVFGRGFEEYADLADAGIAVHIIPGVTSMTSAPAAGGFSLTHRGLVHDVTLVSGHLPPGHPKSLVDWRAVAHMQGTVVLIMAVKNAPAIVAELLRHEGRCTPDTPFAVIENASMPAQRVVTGTLGTLAEQWESEAVRNPAIVLIGPAAAHRMHAR